MCFIFTGLTLYLIGLECLLWSWIALALLYFRTQQPVINCLRSVWSGKKMNFHHHPCSSFLFKSQNTRRFWVLLLCCFCVNSICHTIFYKRERERENFFYSFRSILFALVESFNHNYCLFLPLFLLPLLRRCFVLKSHFPMLEVHFHGLNVETCIFVLLLGLPLPLLLISSMCVPPPS